MNFYWFSTRLRLAVLALLIVLLLGSLGYPVLAPGASFFDGLYMTVITVTTIGYGEVVDLQGNMPARLFTMFIAFAGISIFTYTISIISAQLIEHELGAHRKTRRMEKRISTLTGHYLICGTAVVGQQIAQELLRTKRPFVLAADTEEHLQALQEQFPGGMGLVGDVTEDTFLQKLGIERCGGVFVCTDDDNLNLVVTLTARQLNPQVRIIASCQGARHPEKLRAAGASKVIAPAYIGGLRMASEMVRPTVTNFLDEMMRDQTQNLRIEEIKLAPRLAGSKLGELKQHDPARSVILAIRQGEQWQFNPQPDHSLTNDSTLVLVTSAEERVALEKLYAS